MNKLTRLQQSLAFLQSKGFDQIDNLRLDVYSDSLNLTCWRNEISGDQFFLMKKHFGPLEPNKQSDSVALHGRIRMSEDFRISLTIYRVYECSEVKIEDFSEEKWDELKSQAREGLITIRECKLAE